MVGTRRSITLLVGALLVFGVLSGIIGCGDAGGRLALSGSVTWQGRPLDKGSIVFVPTGGHRGPKIGAEIMAGRYEIDAERGATPGEYRVEVRSDTGEYPHSPTDEKPHAEKPRAAAARSAIAIPAAYNSQSRLNVQVSVEQTTFVFELPSKVP